MDITSEKSLKRVCKLIKMPLDALINNAGVGVFTPFEQRTEKELDQVINVNLKGTILCSKIFSQPMIKAKCGKIINIGSV
ncbi:MAG: SDR family NAD(P)-dependent oxidoreductase, partial [Proteobacteria bacterium]|nr:SDR family NAD(P)-dependent oxidoreductase [Pseudomonadota bacterium]